MLSAASMRDGIDIGAELAYGRAAIGAAATDPGHHVPSRVRHGPIAVRQSRIGLRRTRITPHSIVKQATAGVDPAQLTASETDNASLDRQGAACRSPAIDN